MWEVAAGQGLKVVKKMYHLFLIYFLKQELILRPSTSFSQFYFLSSFWQGPVWADSETDPLILLRSTDFSHLGHLGFTKSRNVFTFQIMEPVKNKSIFFFGTDLVRTR